MSEYELHDLPNFKKIKQLLKTAGKLAIDSGQRIGFHPGQFCVLPSPSPNVVENTINELDKSAQILDLMDLPTRSDIFNEHTSRRFIWRQRICYEKICFKL